VGLAHAHGSGAPAEKPATVGWLLQKGRWAAAGVLSTPGVLREHQILQVKTEKQNLRNGKPGSPSCVQNSFLPVSCIVILAY